MTGSKDFFWLPTSAVLLAAASASVYISLSPLLLGSSPGAATVLLSDATFTAGALLFLACGLRYGKQRHPGGTPPYRGAWLDPAGRQVLPWGFAPHYLMFAFLCSFLLPATAMLACLLLGCSSLGVKLLGGYQAAFVVQMLLETRLFHRNFMSPLVPFTFAPYRFWQLARALWVLQLEHDAATASAAGAEAAVPAWLGTVLAALLAFWVFDYGVTAAQLPWVFNWNLQQPAVGGGADAEKKRNG